MSKMVTRSVLRLLPLLYIYFIWYQSGHFHPSGMSLPAVPAVSLGLLFESAHLIEFGILYLLLVLAFLTYGNIRAGVEIFAAVGSILYAVLDEIHQHFVPFRSASVTDLIKDFIGIFLAWLLVRRSYRSPMSRIGRVLREMGRRSSRDKGLQNDIA